MALKNHLLSDVVIQGHAVKLRDIPGKVFTLSGCHDNWQVYTWSLDQLDLTQGGTPKQHSCSGLASLGGPSHYSWREGGGGPE